MVRHISAMISAIAGVLVTGCATVGGSHESDLYYGFTLIDPATKTRTANAYLVVEKGVIRRLGQGPTPRGLKSSHSHDLTGRYVMPGLIDAHAHITATGIQKVEMQGGKPVVSMESDDRITQHNGRIALSRGVTTVRNPGGDTDANARYDANIASGVWIGPEAKHAGEVIQPPPLGGGMYAYPTNEAEWQAEAERQARLGMTYFKLYAGLTEAELAIGVRVARQHGLKPIAHLNEVSWTKAAALGVQEIEHALPTSADLLAPGVRDTYRAGLGPNSKYMYRWFELADLDGPEITGMMKLLADRRIAVDLTLVVNEIVYNIDDLAVAYPAHERADMAPDTLAGALAGLKMSATGWTAEDYRRARAVMPKVLGFARRLHEAGVPMMIGTDAAGGLFYVRELELHGQAGIPVWDVLQMATSDAARIMEIDNRTGRLQAGFEADFIILKADPVADVRAISAIEGVVSNGVLRAPDDLRGWRP